MSAFATNPPTKQQENDEVISFQVLEANSSFIDILVSANKAVDNFCAYINRSDVSTVFLICAFIPETPVCAVYEVASIACSVKGAVELYIKGDFTRAVIETLTASAKVYQMTQVNMNEFKIQ